VKLKDLVTMLFSKLYNKCNPSGSFGICQLVDECPSMSCMPCSVLGVRLSKVQFGAHTVVNSPLCCFTLLHSFNHFNLLSARLQAMCIIGYMYCNKKIHFDTCHFRKQVQGKKGEYYNRQMYLF
uniref:Uncharacterized protein n=1 Tax=Cricetulus griseus TaxID=10029 RepID=A0A8C2QCX9_CRIGR